MYYQFHDLDKMPTGNGIVLGAEKPYKLFNREDAKRIWYWVNQYKNSVNEIIVNCGAGISRSAGVAAALSKVLNGDDDFYFKYYMPNMLVYKTLLEEHYNNG